MQSALLLRTRPCGSLREWLDFLLRSSSPSPLGLTRVELNDKIGNVCTSKKSALLRCASRSGLRVLIEPTSIEAPNNNLTNALFGRSTQTLANSLGSGGANGGFNPLYQIGGPRSIQLALKLQF